MELLVQQVRTPDCESGCRQFESDTSPALKRLPSRGESVITKISNIKLERSQFSLAYIYKITNQENGKVYIGKTLRSVQERWAEHLRDYIKPRCEKRPLYDAMNKYGIKVFTCELIEECSEEDLSAREEYWINYYNSFHFGYNATKGGDGKAYIDRDQVVALYQLYKNQRQVAKEMQICVDSVHNILVSRNIPIVSDPSPQKKALYQCDLNGSILSSFESGAEAARYIMSTDKTKATKIGTVANKILECANGSRKTAYGYQWKFQ